MDGNTKLRERGWCTRIHLAPLQILPLMGDKVEGEGRNLGYSVKKKKEKSVRLQINIFQLESGAHQARI